MLVRRMLLLATLGLAWPGASPADAAAPGERPHVVLYLADDHGQEFAGCYGNRAVRSPNIDALARSGTVFRNVFAASPTCSPSRAALYTGLYPARNGTMGNHTDSRPGLKSLPTYLKALGYRVVVADSGQALAVGGGGEVAVGLVLALDRLQLLARCRVPEADRPVRVADD